ncbi:phosphotransferase family protein [Frankia torreyi]|uniref:Phosphotransferase family protein n=2 Tax=Frankia TaxID=1854 RepID=A0A0D8B7Y7_9ACTN|nr:MULTISPECIES: oxidoreductase family protein [Frankia]KJE20286.1 phosphotransferase family protein [Frankia torreyi]KQM05320.1 phosphotransferase family protein [Frankia sp. CpI1-P]
MSNSPSLPSAQPWRPDVTELASYGPYARPAPMPMRWDEVTAPWLGAMLANRYPGIEVTDLRTVELRSTHTTKGRVAVTYNEVGRRAGLPEHLCLKANFTGRANPMDICQVEARFYHELVEGTRIPAPRFYYADWDPDGSGQGLAVLEDLIELGGEFGNSYQHIGVDAVGRALDDMAVLHGSYWASPRLDAASWLPTSMDTRGDCDQARIMWWLVEENLGRDVYIERLPAWMVADPQRFLRAYDLLNEYAREQTGPRTIVHGDAYLGNTYLRPDGHRIWLDWQMVRKGHAWRDVSYFMVGALTVEERRAHERELLVRYREALLATGARDVPTADAIWEQYRRWAMYGLQAWMGTKDHWGQDNHTMIGRFSVATADLDTLALLEAQAG